MQRCAIRSRGRARGESGAAAVEFGLVLLPLMVLLLGLIQYGWYFYVSQSASAAAREAARQVIVGDCWNPTGDVTSYVKAQAPMATSASYRTSGDGGASWTTDLSLNTVAVGDLVEVKVAADGEIIGEFLPLPNNGAITQVFEARLEDKTAGTPPCP